MKTLSRAFIFALAACLLASCSGRRDTGGSGSPSATPAPTPNPAAVSPSRETLPKIVAFGDSLTAGYGLAPQESYPSLLQRKLDADGYRYEVVNAGVSGDTSAGGLRRVEWSLSGDVRFLVLELGANDHLRGQPVAETRRNLGEIIRQARARGVKVVLAGMLTPTSAGDRYQREVYEMYRGLAEEHKIALIPFFLERVAGVESLNLEDGVHPNAEGTRIVADNVYSTLKPLLDAESAGRD
jgi:acyl-CoA thioesterase-1